MIIAGKEVARLSIAAEEKKAFRYWLDQKMRTAVMAVMKLATFASEEEQPDLLRQHIKRILVVRSPFRLGDSVLATPAILLLRKNFPAATIDFVGPSIAKKLFNGLSVGRQFEVRRRFPTVCWSYAVLLRKIRKRNYDLAIDVSGSSAAMGSVIVGFSGARFRVGIKSKWDRWFNIRVPRPSSINKYANMPELIASLGLKSQKLFPVLVLSKLETAEAGRRIHGMIGGGSGPVVGIFVGGRKTRGKRWASANFIELAVLPRSQGARPIVFVGPEERDTLPYLRAVLAHRVPVVFEPDVRARAAMVANCDLFVACDSGPLHLACALGVRTVAIFLKSNFDRWEPPAELGRIVYRETGVRVMDILTACRIEVDRRFGEREAGRIVNG